MAVADSAANGEVVKKFQVHATDTGSPEVQVALLTKRLEELGSHFEKHTQDLHSQRGMMRLISRRKKLLHYLRQQDATRYKNLISTLGIRK